MFLMVPGVQVESQCGSDYLAILNIINKLKNTEVLKTKERKKESYKMDNTDEGVIFKTGRDRRPLIEGHLCEKIL